MAVRAALRSLWLDTATITKYEDFIRPNKSTGQREIVALENEPCKLSFESLQPVNQTDTAPVLAQATKLFIDENVVIEPGSKITITRKSGKVFEFKQSGLPGIFTNHQEIQLVPYEDYA